MTAHFTLQRVCYDGALVQPRHRHESMQVSMLLTGAVEETVSDTTYVAAPLHVSVKDAGLAHANRWHERGARLIRLELHAQSLAGITQSGLAPPWRWRFDPVSARAFLRIAADASSSHVSTYNADCADLLAALVAQPIRVDRGTPPRWIVDVVRTVADAWTPQLDTATLAERAGVHPVYLARCVRRWFGVSVGDLLRTERLRRTVARLADSPERVALVAYSYGYADEAHCTRSVRQALGITPAALRRLLLE